MKIQHKASFVLELLCLQLIATVLVTYAFSFFLASNFDIPVGLWRIFRGIYIVGFVLVFLFSIFGQVNNVKMLFLSSDPFNIRGFTLLSILGILALITAFVFYRLATPIFGVTDQVIILKTLGGNLRLFVGIIGVGIAIYAVRHLHVFHNLILLFPKTIKSLVLLLASFTLALPILFHGTINSETHFDEGISSNISGKFENGVGEDIEFKITSTQFKNYLDNFGKTNDSLFVYLHRPENKPIKKEKIENLLSNYFENSIIALWKTNTNKPQELCFFKYNIPKNGIKKFRDCVQSKNIRNIIPHYGSFASHLVGFQRNYENNSKDLVWDHLGQKFGQDTAELYLKAAVLFQRNAQTEPKVFKDIRRYIGNASSTGFYTHHYAAIAHSIDNAPDAISLGSNQYGFGPLFLAKTFKAFGLSSYDGIYLATILANLILAFALIILFRRTTAPSQILISIGFILSITVSFLLNHMFAPMVFSIRYLPSLLLFSYLAYQAINVETNKSQAPQNFTHVIFALFIATYNFEYGIITTTAMAIAAVLHKQKSLIIIYILAIITTISFKTLSGGYDTGSSGINYGGYFSNFVALGRFDRVLIIISLAALIPTFWYFFTRNRDNPSFEKDSIIVLFFMLSFKAGFIGSGNHAGPIFLLIALLSIVFLLRSRTIEKFELRDAAAYTTVAICAVPLFLILLSGRHGLEEKLVFETYSKTNVSQIQPMSKSLRGKLEHAKRLMKKGDIFISPSDSGITLFTQAKVTEPFYDLSTNILEKSSYQKIEKQYSLAKSIIVDRLVSDEVYRQNHIQSLRALTNHDYIAPKYWLVLDKLIVLWKRISILRKNKMKLCGDNKYFQRFCFN